MALHDSSAWLHALNVPPAVVCTERARAIPPRHQQEMAALIPGSELFLYDDGHVACLDPAVGDELARVWLSVSRRIASRRRRHA